MVYSFDGFNYVVRLDKGQRLVASLKQLVAETKLEGAWISGIGATLEFDIGFYDLAKKEYVRRHAKGLHEIVSLNGNLALDQAGEPVIHLHGVFSDRQYQTMGGHVQDLVAGGTVELFVHRAYQPIRRKPDPATGLHVLDL